MVQPSPLHVFLHRDSGRDPNLQWTSPATLTLAAHAWGQTALSTIVSGGYVEFEPSDTAVCYAVVIDNSTNDGRFIPAAEYRP